MRHVIACILFGLVAGPAVAAPPEVRLTNPLHGIKVTVDNGGEVVVVGAFQEVGGKLAFCGVTFMENGNATAGAMSRFVAEQVMIGVNGRFLPVDATVFATYDSIQQAEAAGKARCSVTRLPWDPAILKRKVVMRLRTNTYQ